MKTDLAKLKPGDSIPALEKSPVTRKDLALFAGASGDHNPIHIDSDYARAAGMEDVFAHGMLSMAYVGQLLTNWVSQSAIRRFGVRFTSIAHVGDVLTCSGTVSRIFEEDGELRVEIDVDATDQAGSCKVKGQAVFDVLQKGKK